MLIIIRALNIAHSTSKVYKKRTTTIDVIKNFQKKAFIIIFF